MKKIGDVTSTADKNGEWTNGNVAAGIAPTILEAGWLNSVQREILGVIIAAGMQQDKNDDTQLSKAISKIISGGDYATKTEVNSKLAKDQNGADIPNKPKFIENLGLGEALKKGDFGIGGILKAMASAAESGFYLSASGSDDNPEKGLGFVIINLAASGHYKSQIALTYATETPRAYFRNIFGDVKKPWEPIATKSAIDALNETLKEKLPKNSPAADTRISVTAQDYPVLSLHQSSTGDMFEIVATPTRNSLLFKHTAKNGTTKQVGIPFAEIDAGADIAGQRIRKLYSGSGASLGQSFSFGTNGVGKTLIMFHDGVAKIQALVTTQSYTAYAATGSGTSIGMGVYPDRATYSHNTGSGNITEIWLVG
ncbi:hypothetical protein RN616_10940 [Morganella morganii]|uniref:hypothetical protein n=1 Tax=Morganella morganii TaxID=582 RepID=UPI0028D7A792|nr:hypothetical protein [Morganella morganii]WNP29053.1 hypothetical protein RN616_10940 [Morganella morganii]